MYGHVAEAARKQTPTHMARRAEGPRKLRNRLPKYKTMHINPITMVIAHRDTNKKQTVRAKNQRKTQLKSKQTPCDYTV